MSGRIYIAQLRKDARGYTDRTGVGNLLRVGELRALLDAVEAARLYRARSLPLQYPDGVHPSKQLDAALARFDFGGAFLARQSHKGRNHGQHE